MNYLYSAWLCIITACSATHDNTSTNPPPPTPKPVPVAPREDLPPGWHRLDLTQLSPPLAASATIPAGHSLSSTSSTCRDGDGLLFASTDVSMTLDDGSDVHLSTCPTHGFPLTTLAAAEAIYGTTIVAKDEHPTGEWALTDNRGVVLGWSPRAHVMCRALGTRDRAAAMRICMSVQPTVPSATTRDLAVAFPDAHAPGAREILARLQKATAHQDVAGFLALVDPTGLDIATVHDDTVTVHESVDVLRTELEVSFEGFLHLAKCGPIVYGREPGATCLWEQARGDGTTIVARTIAPARDEWPFVELTRGPTGWRITKLVFRGSSGFVETD